MFSGVLDLLQADLAAVTARLYASIFLPVKEDCYILQTPNLRSRDSPRPEFSRFVDIIPQEKILQHCFLQQFLVSYKSNYR